MIDTKRTAQMIGMLGLEDAVLGDDGKLHALDDDGKPIVVWVDVSPEGFGQALWRYEDSRTCEDMDMGA